MIKSLRGVLLFFLLSTGLVRAGVLPADRSVDWSQVGVPGGVPNVTAVFTNLIGIDNTGATDVSGAINAALGACPSNQVVVLPAGVFLLSNTITMQNGVVLRGQGSSTLLQGNINSTIINFYGPFWYYGHTNLADGFAK